MLENDPHFNAVNLAFPHIGLKFREYWGREGFVAYMEGLLHGTREGTRRGFPTDILLSLHYLAELHKVSYPQFQVSDDFWTYVET